MTLRFWNNIAGQTGLLAVVVALASSGAMAQSSPSASKDSGKKADNKRVEGGNASSTTSTSSDDELKKQIEEANGKFRQQLFAKSVPTKEPPVVKNDLLEQSILLTDGEKFTLIPIGSVLHLPANLQSHVLEKPEGDFTFWPNFLKRNKSWLMTKEVPLDMVKGDPKTAQNILKGLELETRAVVAVYKNSPVTILEPQEAPEVSSASGENPQDKKASQPTKQR